MSCLEQLLQSGQITSDYADSLVQGLTTKRSSRCPALLKGSKRTANKRTDMIRHDPLCTEFLQPSTAAVHNSPAICESALACKVFSMCLQQFGPFQHSAGDESLLYKRNAQMYHKWTNLDLGLHFVDRSGCFHSLCLCLLIASGWARLGAKKHQAMQWCISRLACTKDSKIGYLLKLNHNNRSEHLTCLQNTNIAQRSRNRRELHREYMNMVLKGASLRRPVK